MIWKLNGEISTGLSKISNSKNKQCSLNIFLDIIENMIIFHRIFQIKSKITLRNVIFKPYLYSQIVMIWFQTNVDKEKNVQVKIRSSTLSKE